ncbi:hypothetical protein J0835_05345 [Bacillus cereus group sp. Sample62]|uniref:hypothetical protein n=1 Tax=Bacillus cereus group TaxID=86661 RepID=UPI00086C017A|nr:MULTISPECIES: hypothetical protein [Bacillus cereus group]SCN31587.1 Uncharacterized protein BC067498_00978 [Bacillus cereus]HDR4726355.1 hypothetical protein [Bacillus cereus]HDX9549799.1 hypothetical protein [Bacillus thuringiensis]
MFLPITTFDRFSWLGNVAFSSEKVSRNRVFLRAEELNANLYEKKYIDSVSNIHEKITIDVVKYGDNYVSGHAEPYATVVITSGDMLVGCRRVNEYGEFKIYTNNHLEEYLIIKVQLISDGFYQESIIVKVDC